MRIHLACLLLLLSAAVLAQDANVSARYRKFIEQHIHTNMRENICDAEIQRRGISKTGSNECKETNTFIRSNTGHVRKICQEQRVDDQGMTWSTKPFDLVICTLRNMGARRPHCQYRGQIRTRRIAIRCEQGFPVHYDGDVLHLDH